MTTIWRRCSGLAHGGAMVAACAWLPTASAQVVSAPTTPVIGHAPTVTIEVTNETVPGRAAAAGHQLRAHATVVDPDGDPILGIDYRWLRGTAEVGTGPTYTTVASDSGQSLAVEANATTDPATTDPSSGTGAVKVDVLANTAPVASRVRFEGDLTVGSTLRWEYDYYDADGDEEGATRYEWCRRGETCGLSAARTYTLVADDEGYFIHGGVTPKSATGIPNTGMTVDYDTDLTAQWRVTRTTATAVTTAQVLTVGQAGGTFIPLTNVTGGKPPYVHEVQTGTLPAGLMLESATGEVKGTPTAVRPAADVVFRVKDANGVYATTGSTVRYTVNANTAPEAAALAITGDLTVGSTVIGSYTYHDVDGDAEGNTLIEWCHWDVEPCKQVGTLGMGDPLRYTLKDTDAGAVGFHLRITPKAASGALQGVRVNTGRFDYPVTRITATAVTTAQVLTVGQPGYSFSPLTNVTGGKVPYTYEVQTDSTLPTGLALDPATGEVKGTPTAHDAANVTFRVKDANNVHATTTSTVQFTVQGNAPVASNPAISGELVVGQTLTATYDFHDADNDPEGATTFNWCWRNEDCGKGSGRTYLLTTADVGKEMSVQITPRSASGVPDTGSMVAAHAGGAVYRLLTATANTTAQVFTERQAAPDFSPLTSVSGGIPPYSYRVYSGALPQGLSLNSSTGVVSGTPTETRPASIVEFRVRDTQGVDAATTSRVSYTVRPPILSFSGVGSYFFWPSRTQLTSATSNVPGNASANSKLRIKWTGYNLGGLTVLLGKNGVYVDLTDRCPPGEDVDTVCEVPVDLSAYPRTGQWDFVFSLPESRGGAGATIHLLELEF